MDWPPQSLMQCGLTYTENGTKDSQNPKKGFGMYLKNLENYSGRLLKELGESQGVKAVM